MALRASPSASSRKRKAGSVSRLKQHINNYRPLSSASIVVPSVYINHIFAVRPSCHAFVIELPWPPSLSRPMGVAGSRLDDRRWRHLVEFDYPRRRCGGGGHRVTDPRRCPSSRRRWRSRQLESVLFLLLPLTALRRGAPCH